MSRITILKSTIRVIHSFCVFLPDETTGIWYYVQWEKKAKKMPFEINIRKADSKHAFMYGELVCTFYDVEERPAIKHSQGFLKSFLQKQLNNLKKD